MTSNALLEKLKEVTSYNDLLQVALGYITEQGFDTIVLGPIFAHGPDHTANNLDKLETTISDLESRGIRVLSQIPFLDINLAQETQMHHFETEQKFHEFYFPLFRSGLLKTAYFMPDWEASRGASWEHECCQENNLIIKYL